MKLRHFLVLTFVFLFTSVSFADPRFLERHDVREFINMMVERHHFDRAELVEIFSNVHLRPRVIQSLRAPLEAQTWANYQPVFIEESHISQGVDFWNRNWKALERAERIYGVPASIIVATIGVETKYGKNKGEYPVIDALASIGFSDSHRASYFRHELEEFLILSREQHLDPIRVRGSYAGAIGQPQFMPSSYRHYAVNFSGNDTIDLSNNADDIIGSIANYYKKHGWKTDQPVAYQMQSPHIPSHLKGKLIELEGRHGNEYWLGLNNFEVIKRYNPSNLYAMAVYQLSYYISSRREQLHHG